MKNTFEFARFYLISSLTILSFSILFNVSLAFAGELRPFPAGSYGVTPASIPPQDASQGQFRPPEQRAIRSDVEPKTMYDNEYYQQITKDISKLPVTGLNNLKGDLYKRLEAALDEGDSYYAKHYVELLKIVDKVKGDKLEKEKKKDGQSP